MFHVKRFPWEALYPPGVRWDAALPAGTLPGLLDEAVGLHRERVAIRFRSIGITYRELGERVGRAAAALARAGVGAGSTVALLLPNTPWHPVAFFAVLRLGARVVHLSPLEPVRAHARKVADSGAGWVVTTDLAPVLEASRGLGVPVLVGSDAAWEGGAGGELAAAGEVGAVAIDAGAVALLQYTGGTTGVPRAAMLTHRNLTSAVSIYRAWQAGSVREVRPGDLVLGVLPLFHIYALTAVMLRCFACGGTLLLRERFEVGRTLADIGAGCAHVAGVPTMWIAIAHAPGVERVDFSALRAASSGGAALPHEVGERLARFTGVWIGGGWGMTETGPAGTNLVPGRAAAPGEIGVPLPGIEMGVVAAEDAGRVLGPGEVGELRVRGPNVMAGYWRRPEETRAALVDGWLLTGDLGRMTEDGRFVLVDRKKDMIISGGFNVYPRVIEEAIHEHPDVMEAAVVGVADAYRGEAARAYVVLRAGAGMTLEGLRGFLGERLGRHELPASLVVRESLPRTAVGKLAKRELR